MLDLILKLIDKLVQLAEKRREENRSVYDDFIAPIISDFEEAHKDYISTFSE